MQGRADRTARPGGGIRHDPDLVAGAKGLVEHTPDLAQSFLYEGDGRIAADKKDHRRNPDFFW